LGELNIDSKTKLSHTSGEEESNSSLNPLPYELPLEPDI